MTNRTITLSQADQPKGSGSLEFDGLLAAFHAIVWATAEDDDPELAYDEAGNVEAKKLQAMYRALQAELTKARELLTDVASNLRIARGCLEDISKGNASSYTTIREMAADTLKATALPEKS